jgi:hypothetical protein
MDFPSRSIGGIGTLRRCFILRTDLPSSLTPLNQKQAAKSRLYNSETMTLELQISIRALLALFAFAALLIAAAGNCTAQLPELSPQEVAQRHEAMVARIQTLEIVTDTSYGPQWKLHETNKFWLEGDQRRFIIEPLNRDHSCTDCYCDGKTLFRIQRRNADLQIPKKVSIYGSSGLIGIVQEGGNLHQVNYAL